jgi:AcrR family transcriptional regulator
MATEASTARKRVPASERRDALIDAAIHEFAHGGLHGTPVDRIARRVGVAQPYVFSLFASKKELFLDAVDRAFQVMADVFTRAADEFDPAIAVPEADPSWALSNAYLDLLDEDRDILLLQHQAYAACDEEDVRARVKVAYDALAQHVKDLTGVDDEGLDEFFRYGMWINVRAAMGELEPCKRREWRRG